MKSVGLIASIAAIVSIFALAAGPAKAWTHRSHQYPSYSALRFYSSPQRSVRYYRACGYGDCPCLRSIAVRTGSQVWWDRYQACAG